MMKVNPFNNSIDSGLRTLCILNELYPLGFDLQTLIYLDYITIHSGDFGSKLTSLHPAVPYRTGEIFVRRTSIKQGLELYTSKGLIEISYHSEGLVYSASESSSQFVEILQETYTIELNKRIKWMSEYIKQFKINHLKDIIEEQAKTINHEFKIGLLK